MRQVPFLLVEGQGDAFVLAPRQSGELRQTPQELLEATLRSALNPTGLTTANGILAPGGHQGLWHLGSRPKCRPWVLCNSINMYYFVQALG